MYLLAPVLTLIPAFLIFMVVPIGQPFTVTLGGVERVISMQGTDLNVGALLHPGDVVAGCVRRGAGRMVFGIEIPIAGWCQSDCPGDLL